MIYPENIAGGIIIHAFSFRYLQSTSPWLHSVVANYRPTLLRAKPIYLSTPATRYAVAP